MIKNMYFKNKTTGITWHITDETHIKRLEGDSNYIKVTNTNTPKTDEIVKHEPIQDSITDKVDYTSIDWHELRKLAADKGINTKGLKRDEIEKELAKLGDEDVTK